MEKRFGPYLVSDDPSLVDFDTVHQWLTGSYWSPGISREKVEKAALHTALVVGVYSGREQAAYMRVIGDSTTFAWIADVFVGEEHRRKGIGKEMVRFALEHPEWQGLRRWVLATRDAH